MKAATGQSDSSAPSLSRNISDLVTTGRDYEVDTVLSDNLDGIKSLQEEIAAADILSQRLSSPISVGSASRNGTKATRLSSEDMKSLALIVTPDTNKRPEAFCHSAPMTPDLFSSIKPPSETIVTLPFLFVNESTESANQLQGLVTLSNMTIITSNALKEQKNFLPDSIVPTVDLNHGEETSEEQQERLRTENIHLLYDGTKQRANFIAPPKEVIELLREVWNLNREESKPDRVGRKLVPVQSFYPNLLNHLLRTPGFPSLAGSFDSDIFKPSGKKKVKTVEKTFKSLIRQALEDMGYSCAGQDIEFYLSFMKTKNRTVAQDPHIDFKFPAVDPWYVDESPSTRRAKRGRRHDYTERVPFIAFFPLTEAGMAVEVWPARADHRTGRDGVLVHIPFGSMMIARGDVVHAGGFSSFPNGNPRCHLYIYRSEGEVHDINTSNTYTIDIDGETIHMSKLYAHGAGI